MANGGKTIPVTRRILDSSNPVRAPINQNRAPALNPAGAAAAAPPANPANANPVAQNPAADGSKRFGIFVLFISIIGFFVYIYHFVTTSTFGEPDNFVYEPTPDSKDLTFDSALVPNPNNAPIQSGILNLAHNLLNVANKTLQEDLLPCSMSAFILERLKSASPSIQLSLETNTKPSIFTLARWDEKTQKINCNIGVAHYMKDSANHYMLPRIAHSQFFQALTMQANVERFGSKFNKFFQSAKWPFMGLNYEDDEHLKSTFLYVIKSAQTNIRTLEDLLSTDPENKILKQAKKVFEHYQPIIHFKVFRSETKIKKFLAKKDSQGNVLYNSKSTIELKNNQYMLYYTHNAASKTALFVKDYHHLSTFLKLPKTFENEQQKSHYFFNSLAKEGTILWSFPAAIKQFIAPQLCNHMTDYLKLDGNNACAIPDGPKCKR